MSDCERVPLNMTRSAIPVAESAQRSDCFDKFLDGAKLIEVSGSLGTVRRLSISGLMGALPVESSMSSYSAQRTAWQSTRLRIAQDADGSPRGLGRPDLSYFGHVTVSHDCFHCSTPKRLRDSPLVLPGLRINNELELQLPSVDGTIHTIRSIAHFSQRCDKSCCSNSDWYDLYGRLACLPAFVLGDIQVLW